MNFIVVPKSQSRKISPSKVLAVSISVLVASFSFAQQKTKDTIRVNQLEEVLLKSTRVKDKSPFAFTNISKKELEKTNLGQDLPILLDQLPSVVTTSDAGAGVGYTGIRVRGSDATRVNVTINGIPYNDAESHGTYFVDLPDFTSSIEDIQLQRGVGTSTNGSGAFGASLNLKTLRPSNESFATISNSIGSFGTRKHTLSVGTGIKNGFYATARLSKIASDGYIDRASSDLTSFYTEAGFVGKNTSVKAIVFGGKEKTYQSWYGTPEAVVNGDVDGIKAFIARNGFDMSPTDISNLENASRKFNYYNYNNQTDNYEQYHYQLHFSQKINDNLSASVSGNVTPGKGFYEEFKFNNKFGKYFPLSPDAGDKSDVIRRKWAASDFYALVYSLNYNKNNYSFNFGGGYNKYDGSRFGEILWSQFKTVLPFLTQYYQSSILKEDTNFYLKGEYQFNDKLIGFADIQFRGVSYRTSGLTSSVAPIDIAKKYSFFNPKAGLTYLLNAENTVYASVSVGNREPNGDDLTKNPTEPKPERLIDYELGYKLNSTKISASANFYFMDYKDQLVLTGELDDVGNGVRQNVAKSYRAGLELQVAYKVSDKFRIDANTTFSKNKIESFDYLVYDTQYDPITYDEVSTTAIVTKYKDTDIAFSPEVILGNTLTYSPVKNLDFGFISKFVDKQFLDNTSTNSRSMKSYFVNNFLVTYKLKPKWIKEIGFNLLINNLFDQKYVSNGYTYSYYYRAQGSSDDAITENFYYPQAGVNFLAGLNLKF
ncbi:MAG: iron complex outerrane recepter protein [Bacteroidota bacterium]|nr:iron complex outerrane recepter protein [Bacteroidota bacterium]